jgi:DNA-binding transcriptional MerR regulator
MKKLYYTIGEVSKLTGVEAHQLRYWEAKISDLKPAKSANGTRKYREEELDLIFKLRELIIEKKYSTEGALQFLNGGKAKLPAPKKTAKLEKDLRMVRSFLQDLQGRL